MYINKIGGEIYSPPMKGSPFRSASINIYITMMLTDEARR